MVARSAPGSLLGFFVVVGTVAAALAIRPRAGRMIFPVPVLSYLVAALLSGAVFDRSGSKTMLAIDAAQWIASGFFAMALATVLAVVIITARWFLWRRGRPATRDPGWPVPPTGPARTGPTRAGTVRAGSVQPGTGQAGTGQAGSSAQPGTAARRAQDAMVRRGRRGVPGGPQRNPGIPRASRVRVACGRAGRSAVVGVPGLLGSWGGGAAWPARPARHRSSARAASRSRALQLLQRGVTEH